jgi:hypothetical protein
MTERITARPGIYGPSQANGQPLGQAAFISATALLDCVFRPDRALMTLLTCAAEGGVLRLLAAFLTSFTELDSWLT